MLARWLRFVDLRHGCLDIVSLPVSERGRNLQCRGALGGELVFAFACGASSAQRAMHFSTFSFRAGSAEAHEGSKGPSGNCCATLVADERVEILCKLACRQSNVHAPTPFRFFCACRSRCCFLFVCAFFLSIHFMCFRLSIVDFFKKVVVAEPGCAPRRTGRFSATKWLAFNHYSHRSISVRNRSSDT